MTRRTQNVRLGLPRVDLRSLDYQKNASLRSTTYDHPSEFDA